MNTTLKNKIKNKWSKWGIITLITLILAVYISSNNSGKSTPRSNISYSSIKPQVIKLETLPEYEGIGGIIAADVDNDARYDYIITRPGYISAYSNLGNKLWSKKTDIQVAGQSEKQGLPGWLGAGVQAADVDGDSKTEVLYLTKDNSLQIIQGNNGAVKHRISLPNSPPDTERWEHLVIGNFQGKGDRDLLLQTTNIGDYRWGKYLAAYSIEELITASSPQPLWTRDDFEAAAHNGAKLADLDGDGRDEVISGNILNSQGETIYTFPLKRDNGASKPHIDAIAIADVRPDLTGLEVISLEEGGNYSFGSQSSGLNKLLLKIANRLTGNNLWQQNRIFLYNNKQLIWQNDYKRQEPQNVIAGDFDPNRPGLEIWCRSRYEENQKPFVFDAKGKLISHYEMKKVAPSDWSAGGVDVIYTIDWTGKPKQLAAAKERNGNNRNTVIFDPITGEFLYRFPTQADVLYVADVTGDWREELIAVESDRLLVYSNPEPNSNPSHTSLWNQPHYQHNKTNWNYYSP